MKEARRFSHTTCYRLKLKLIPRKWNIRFTQNSLVFDDFYRKGFDSLFFSGNFCRKKTGGEWPEAENPHWLASFQYQNHQGYNCKELTYFGLFKAVEFLRTNLHFCSGILSPPSLSWLQGFSETCRSQFWLSSLNILMVPHVGQKRGWHTKKDSC